MASNEYNHHGNHHVDPMNQNEHHGAHPDLRHDDPYSHCNHEYDQAGHGDQEDYGYYDESGYYHANSRNAYYNNGGYYDAYDQQEDPYYSENPYGHEDGYHDGEKYTDDGKCAHGLETPGSDDYGSRYGSSRVPSYNGMDTNSELPSRNLEPYPAWPSDGQVPISKEEIEDIFLNLTAKFGFQRDSMRNMYDHFMVLLDSRASRMPANEALTSLHADYIGGINSNYRKWYFAASLDLEGRGFSNTMGKNKAKKKKGKKSEQPVEIEAAAVEQGFEDLSGATSLKVTEAQWELKMRTMMPHERARQVALYLLCWGEANQVRFMPEALCFIFKCAHDYLVATGDSAPKQSLEEGSYLESVITPLYQYLRNQGYEILNGVYVRREKDHKDIIGYDDCNQLFWYPEGLGRIVFGDGARLMNLPAPERYHKLREVEWKKVFFKTYKETRSWMHMLVNFNRIWIIHFTMFWFYTSHNAPSLIVKDYDYRTDVQPSGAKQFSIVGFGGAIATVIQILATLAEWVYVPRRWPGAKPLTARLLVLLVILVLNIGPGIKIFMIPFSKDDPKYEIDLALGIVQFVIAVLTYLYFSIIPLEQLFGPFLKSNTGRTNASQTFTASFSSLSFSHRSTSVGLWVVVFGIKFGVSYKFLTLSYRDVIRYLGVAKVDCTGDHLFGQSANILCKHQNIVLLVLTGVTDVIFFFLDTYLWYVLCNSVFSVATSFYLGSSILSPWRSVFARLPKRIYSKILATSDMEVRYQPKLLVSQVWNAVVISMYREHLIAIEHAQKLLYYQVPSEQPGKRTLRPPTFFISKDDNSFKTEFFPVNSEAERRLSFFAQSLSMPLPDPTPVASMPTFTVLIPHYGEKILLTLREIIREEDIYSRVTLLEYLKQLYPHEWDCFVNDTKTLADETAAVPEEVDAERKKIDDLPFYCIGFKSSAPEYTLRTRIWASLRSQTLYRTVSGFMNYARAIKLLYRVENPDVAAAFGRHTDLLDQELEKVARRKFRMLISMQRYTRFTKKEMENAEFLLRAYPDIQIAYLDEEPGEEGEEPKIFSALIDGHCDTLEDGLRRPKFRVRLSGHPILGDGKSDNQNHALIFYRGEYIQLIDANQDNYLEECLKIRNVLAEFDEMTPRKESPYTRVKDEPTPVAIVGAREYIFSENIGVLGDIAAGKEQTFGTLFARTLTQIGAKLHYGHPDFLNGIFMTTRGGVSKAQKGLHLNEDIFAGMTAITRGGRIKHSEYYQCGKGRDLGFGSVLNFTTKIGTGMGEQLLSREYYYLGTQLPLDRFLSFYYAHPGFHVNNMFIMVSIQLFMICLLNIGAFRHETIACDYNRQKPITDIMYPIGCVNTDALTDWIWRSIMSIFVVLFMAFVPLVVHELIDRGIFKAFTRFLKQFFSLSLFFEIFSNQIYANSIEQDISYGGARYIGTGRGFATARIPFSILYSRFAGHSIYLGARLLLCLLFATATIWQPALIYFWITLLGLTISPFLYNPHQFGWDDFFIDYREFLRWLSRGNSRTHNSSWIAFCRLSRTRVVGCKRKVMGDKSHVDVTKPPKLNLFLSEIFAPFLLVVVTLIPYLFINAQTGVLKENQGKSGSSDGGSDNKTTTTRADKSDAITPTDSLLRVLIVALAPVIGNIAVLGASFGMACCMGPLLGLCCKKSGAALAAVAHALAVMFVLASFEAMLVLESFSFARTIAGVVAVIAIQRFVVKLIITLALTREFKTDQSNLAFWSGKWYSMGWHSISQPLRELLCKVTELSMFAGDFILGHWLLILMFPVLMIPQIDKLHSILLFWLLPSRQIRPPIYSLKQSRLRRRRVVRYFILYFVLLVSFVGMIAGPIAYANAVRSPSLLDSIPAEIAGFRLLQPNHQNNNNTSPSRTGS